MVNFRVVVAYLQTKVAAFADAAPGFVSGGIAPSLYYIETLPHNSFANTSSDNDFTKLQNDLIKRKQKKKRIQQELKDKQEDVVQDIR